MQTSLASVLTHFESEAKSADELMRSTTDDGRIIRYRTERDTYNYVVRQIRAAHHPDPEEEEGDDRHRIEICFDGGIPGLKLIHPQSGCEGGTQCGLCAADLTDPDPEARRCYDCQDLELGECWLQGWVDNLDADELVHGRITVPITAEWDQDHPIVTLHQPTANLSGEGLTVSAVKAALLSREAADEVADEFTEGEEGIHPDFVQSIAEALLRTIAFESIAFPETETTDREEQ